MTHDELLAKITAKQDPCCFQSDPRAWLILRAVVELHKPVEAEYFDNPVCAACSPDIYIYFDYPCKTIQAIEKELGL